MPKIRNEPPSVDPRSLRRWVCWKEIPPDKPGGKPKKLPINPRTEKAASATNPADWTTVEEAEAALKKHSEYAGLMFAMVPEDGLVFIDLDRCRNPTNRTIKIWATNILKKLNSYSEVSPSDTGVHVLVKATKPGELCRRGHVEIYDHGRFACMTGRRLTTYPEEIESRQAELEAVYKEHIAISQTGTERAVPGVPVPEDKLAALLKNAKAKTIYEGEQNGEYTSQSEADLALMNVAVKVNFTEPECRTLIETARENAGAEAKHDGYFRATFAKARGDLVPVALKAARTVFKTHLDFPDSTIIDVTLAVVASSHLPGDPAWLHLVAPASSGKTECINSVAEWPAVYSLSELTPAGLVSGRDSNDGQDHSLLPKLNHKTLAIKDFTPVIDAPKEMRQKLFGRLRDAFDGAQAVHTAMVGTRAHKGTFNCITGVTNAIEKVWRNTSLGERYLLYRHTAADPLESARRALLGAPIKKQMRDELRRAACGVLAGVDQDCVPNCPKRIREAIVHVAAMLAKGRTYVERSHDHKVEYAPESEGPARIAQQLFKLGQGLALINRRNEIDGSDLKILRRVALDSIPLTRRKFIAVLARSPQAKEVATKDLMGVTGLSQSAVHQGMEDLCLLGIATKREVPTKGVTKTNAYKLSPAFRELVEGIDF